MLTRRFAGSLLLLVLALSLAGAGSRAGAAVQAIRLEGDYLGTYTPDGGSASQLQMFLLDPGPGGAFTGEGNIRVDGVLHPVDIAGTVRRRGRRITFRAILTGTEFNDRVELRGRLRRDKITGRFNGTVGGPNLSGKFSLTKV